jgi:glycosyltransferase involved in cell wall biosynthesis
MKVMLLIPHVSDGGAEKILSELSLGFRTDELVLVVFQRKIDYPFKGRIISMDMAIQKKSIIGRITGFIRRSYRFRQILRQERPDVVLSFLGEANFINALFSARPILTVHNYLSSMSQFRGKFEALVFQILVRLLYRRATVVAVSEAVKNDLVDSFRIPADQVVVIRNAVDTRKIREMAAEPAASPWDTTIPVVITVGRLCKEKGQWHLIRAFAEVRRKLPCQLAILGTGELEEYLKRVAKELGVENDVFFLGWHPNPFKFMAKADVFVLPSLTEGLPLALVEAMACGLPAIATGSEGSKEILAPRGGCKYGVLVPSPDTTMYSGFDPCTAAELEMAEAIQRMLDDRETRNRYIHAGLSRVRDFDSANFAENYQRLLSI